MNFTIIIYHVVIVLAGPTTTEVPTKSSTPIEPTNMTAVGTTEITTEEPTSTTEEPETPSSATPSSTTTASPTTIGTTTTTKKPYHSNFKNVDCNFTACLAPECQCLQDLPPNGMNPDDIPQFVIVTFDGAVTVTNFPYYQTLFDFKNPNNCPIQSTYFVSHVDSNYKLVHELYRRGNEIGVHSIRYVTN